MTFLLTVALFLWFPLQASPKNGFIEGTVTRFGTGDPIPDVEIVMNGSGRSTRGLTPQAITDYRGHFVIRDVPPGSYSIQAQRMGYANPAPNGVRVLEGGATRTVAVAAGEHTENANLALVRSGAISGRVLDSAGKPLVDLYGVAITTDGNPGSQGSTDDRGDYHFVGIPPGKYYMSFEATYFPGVSDKTMATVLEISEGTVLTGIDITVNNGTTPSVSDKTFNISGKVLDRDGGPMPGIFQVVNLLPHTPFASGKQSVYRESGGSGSGVFYFTGVRPGRYDAFLYFNGSTSLMANRSLLGAIGRVEVNVGDGDVKDIVLTPGGVSVTGQLTSIGNARGPSASVRLKMPSNSVQSRESKIGTAGEFTIPNVVSGVWKLVVTDLPADLALLDVRQGDISVYDDGFPVEDRTLKPVQVVVGAGGTIGGIVHNEQNGPVGAAQVLLIANLPDPMHPAMHFRKTTTDGTGRFTISNVAAGLYKVYALDPSNFPAESIPDTAAGVSRILSPEIRSKGVAATAASGSRLELSLLSVH